MHLNVIYENSKNKRSRRHIYFSIVYREAISLEEGEAIARAWGLRCEGRSPWGEVGRSPQFRSSNCRKVEP